jgi:hypothetical protein
MLKIVLAIFLVYFFTSCKEIPGPYTQIPDPIDTTKWQDSYVYGGVLATPVTPIQNSLNGTKWVLVKVVSAFSTNYPNDTINFVSNSKYVLNQNAQRSYTLTGITGSTNKSLTLQYFHPFGGSHYSGQVGELFVEDGYMSNIEFVNLQNSTATIRAWFMKI